MIPRPRHSRGALAFAVTLVALAGCRRAGPPAPAAFEAFEVSGCAAIDGDGTCRVHGGAVRVFVASLAEATFASGAGPVGAEAVATFDDGKLYALHLPPDGARGGPRIRIVLAGAEGHFDARDEAPVPWVDEADARASRGDDDGALAIYRDHRLAADAGEAALAAGQAARLELGRGRVDESVALFREAIARDRAGNRLSSAIDDSLALAFALGERGHQLTQARAALDGIRDLLDRYPDGRAREPYYRAVLDCETGNRREALARFREAKRRATRLGLTRLAHTVDSSMASELDLLGRFDEALAIRRALDRDAGGGADPCERLIARSGMGFGLLLMAMQPGADPARLGEARAALEQARSETECADRYLHAVTLGNLALAALLAGHAEDAASDLAGARAGATEPPPSESFFWLDLEGRVALARGAPAVALRVYDEMRERAHAALLPEHEWSALAGRGAALEALGRPRDAIAAYEQAEETLGDAGLAIPVGEGRARFLVERGRSATAAIALLVARGERAEALRWARRSRRRVLAGLEATRRLAQQGPAERARWDAALDAYVRERAAIDDEAALDWKLPVTDLARARGRRRDREVALRSALEKVLSAPGAGSPATALPASPAPGPGELTLLLHPAARGWTAMAADDAGVTVFAVPPFDAHGSPESIARLVLWPARASIDRATRVRILLPGELASIDVHALPYPAPPREAADSGAGAGPLIARVRVEYAADLDEPSAPLAEPPRALVVGDPQRNLPEARREAGVVAGALGARNGIDVTVLEADAATHAAVVGALGAASLGLFHYAGHASYAGEDGWDSALPLAEGGRLLVTDVLALRHAPARVVVSGCSAGRTSSASPEALGIAQAFLVAGSDAVVAPARDVDDALSARFVTLLYAALEADPAMDLPRAARQAQLALRAADPGVDWASFRVFRRR